MRPGGQQQRDPRRIREQLPGDPLPDPDAVPGDQLQQLPEILDVQQVDPEQLPGVVHRRWKRCGQKADKIGRCWPCIGQYAKH